MNTPPLRVVQLSDLHFGARPAPVDGRVAEQTFADVVAHLRATSAAPDLFVATGDLTDDGADPAVAELHTALAALPAPVHLLAGNHDRESTLAGLTRPGAPGSPLRAVRSSRHGPWLFCYVDSNATGRIHQADGSITDHPDRAHAGATGAVDDAELAALDRLLATSDAPHAMVWVHHPPVLPDVFASDHRASPYAASLLGLLGRHPQVHGVACGHLHTGYVARHGALVVYGTSTTWLAMDFVLWCLTPPGYRTFAFGADGRVESASVLVDHERYRARQELPEWVGRVLGSHFGVTRVDQAG